MSNSPLLLRALLFALFLAACSSDDVDTLVVGQGVADTNAPAEEPTPTTTSETPTTSSTTSSTSTTFTTSEAPATSEPIPETTTEPARGEIIEELGPAMIGGDWAVIRPVSEDDIDCSNDGTLAYLVDGEVVHRYEDLGGLGGVRLYNGRRGQDAFVINCEESVGRVLIQGSAILPPFGWPELADFRFYDSDFENFWMDYSGDYGWRGDMFGVHATTFEDGASFDELFVFDSYTLSIEALHSRVGTRLTDDSVPGVDVISPTIWTVESTAEFLSTASTDSFSHVQVTRQPAEAIAAPLPEGDELLSSDDVLLRLWSVPDADGRARVISRVTASEWFYLGEEGVRLVRQIPVGDDVVEIEMYADDADGSPSQDLPWLTLELIRVFEE